MMMERSDSATQDHTKQTYRTHNRAGLVTKMPDKYVIITNAKYKDAISLLENNKACLHAIKADKRMKIENGVLCIDGLAASTSEIYQFDTRDNIEDLDLPLLRALYSIIFSEAENSLKKKKALPQIITMYVPDFFRYLDKDRPGRNEVVSLIQNISRFNSLVGIINGDILPVLLYMGERQETNTISFASPYLSRVFEETYKDSISKDKKGRILTNDDGKPKTKASHSFLIKPSIRNERNKRAVEIVHIVVCLIERAGNHTPHIKAQTIVEQNPLLMYALENNSKSRQNQILKRSFQKAWELLRTHTELEQKYKNIQLPDETKSSNIPTMSTLDIVFEFKHSGKIKKND